MARSVGFPDIDEWQEKVREVAVTPDEIEVEAGVTQHVVMFSGGISSWSAARRVAAEHGTAHLWLAFADTSMEAPDLYRFLLEGAEDVGGQLIHICDGRTPFEVYEDERFLGNSRADPCSRILKREPLRKLLEDHFNPDETVCYIGFDWTEPHRMERAWGYWDPWTVEAPMMDDPPVTKKGMIEMAREADIEPPEAYEYGFSHNNCRSFCCKAGQGHFKRLLDAHPERYAYFEKREEDVRELLDKDVSILRDRSGGETTPLTLADLRKRAQDDPDQIDMFDLGGCSCMDPAPDEEDSRRWG